MKNFIKIGDNIYFKPSTNGLNYELEAGKIYNIKYDRYTGDILFQIVSTFNLPSKIYNTEKDNIFINKILKKYENTDSGVLGVMLSGLKGSGKTVTMKQIAIKSNLPIILLDKEFPEFKFKFLFQNMIDIEACFVFDELDKKDSKSNMSDLLQVLDGMNTVGKKLMLFACNDEKNVSEYLIDRCSRVRYWKRFNKMEKDMIKQIVTDKLNKDEDIIDEVSNFIYDNFDCISFDNILSFVDEIITFPNENLKELFDDMNLTKKK